MDKLRIATWPGVFLVLLSMACGPKPKQEVAANTVDVASEAVAPAEPVQTDTTPACAPKYARHPVNVTVAAGESAELSVNVTGEGPFAYLWYEADPSGSKLLRESASKITVTPKRTTGYFVWTSNGCGARISNLATVTIR